jgi:hypothetical protein
MKKKVFKQKDGLTELISALMELQKETGHCVFFGYEGHVNGIELRIAKNRKQWRDVVFRKSIYLDVPGDIEAFGECIRVIKDREF